MQRSLCKTSWGLSRALNNFNLSHRSVGNTVIPLAPPPPPPQYAMPMDGKSFNWLDSRPVPPQMIKLMMSNFGRASLVASDKSWQYHGWLESILAVETPLETTIFAQSNDNLNSGTGKTGRSPPKGSSWFSNNDGDDDDAADDGDDEQPRAESRREQTDMEHEGVYWTGDGQRVDTRLLEVDQDQDQDAYVTGDGKFARKQQPELTPSDKPKAPTKSKK